MTITESEIYRMQKVIDICQLTIKLWEEIKRETANDFEEKKISNLINNATIEFYQISESIFERNKKC